jgi:hypothetical protein
MNQEKIINIEVGYTSIYGNSIANSGEDGYILCNVKKLIETIYADNIFPLPEDVKTLLREYINRLTTDSSGEDWHLIGYEGPEFEFDINRTQYLCDFLNGIFFIKGIWGYKFQIGKFDVRGRTYIDNNWVYDYHNYTEINALLDLGIK